MRRAIKKWKTKRGNTVYQTLNGRSNSYLISTTDYNILVDTGKSSAYKKLLSGIESLNLINKQIDFLILTHTHFDHCQNAALIEEKYQCKIILSAKDNEFIKKGYTPLPKGTNFLTEIISGFATNFLWKKCCYRPFVGNILIKDSFNSEELFSGIRIIKTEGHSQSSISIIVDNEIAIVGDAMFGVFKNSIFPPFADNPVELIKSWKILLNTTCEIFLPGHGGIILRDLLKKNYEKYSKAKSISRIS